MIVSASSENSKAARFHIPEPENTQTIQVPPRDYESDCRIQGGSPNRVVDQNNLLPPFLPSRTAYFRPEDDQISKKIKQTSDAGGSNRKVRGTHRTPSYIYGKNQILMLPRRWRPSSPKREPADQRWVAMPQPENKACKHIIRLTNTKSSLSCVQERTSELQVDSLKRLKSTMNPIRNCLQSVQSMRTSLVKVSKPAGDLIFLSDSKSISLQPLSDHLSYSSSLVKASLGID